MRILSWTVGVPVAVIAVTFAVANRHPVRIELWPLPVQVEAPLYLAVLGTFLLGIVLGAVAAWLGGRHWRSAARGNRRRAEALEREVAELRRAANQTSGREVVVTQPGDGAR